MLEPCNPGGASALLAFITNGQTNARGPAVPRRLRSFFRSYFEDEGRRLPWRSKSRSDREFLIAEVLLRQTKAENVVPVWRSLVKQYTSYAKLANAPTRRLVEALAPLGLQRQRARALRELARELHDRRGRLPTSPQGLLQLPHVGLYSTTAILCFRRNRRVPIVDANVLRVLGRLFGVPLGRDLRRSSLAWAYARSLLPRTGAAAHNYGLLDFAARVCTSRAPACQCCPVREMCHFGRGAQRGVALATGH
jgi:A/G-specific adenine glycosylase